MRQIAPLGMLSTKLIGASRFWLQKCQVNLGERRSQEQQQVDFVLRDRANYLMLHLVLLHILKQVFNKPRRGYQYLQIQHSHPQ